MPGPRTPQRPSPGPPPRREPDYGRRRRPEPEPGHKAREAVVGRHRPSHQQRGHHEDEAVLEQLGHRHGRRRPDLTANVAAFIANPVLGFPGLKLGLADRMLRVVKKEVQATPLSPLLVELLRRPVERRALGVPLVPVQLPRDDRRPGARLRGGCDLAQPALAALRQTVRAVSESLDPADVDPLTFGRLVEVLGQNSAEALARHGVNWRVKELSELAAYEAIGLSRIFALARDDKVTEFYADSEATPSTSTTPRRAGARPGSSLRSGRPTRYRPTSTPSAATPWTSRPRP